MIVSFSGQKGVGKDFAAKAFRLLQACPHFTDKTILQFMNRPILNQDWEHHKWNDKINDIYKELTGIDYFTLNEVEKLINEPEFLDFSNNMKEFFGDNVWVNYLMTKYRPGKNWVISDTEFLIEKQAVEERDGINILVRRDDMDSELNNELKDEQFDYHLNFIGGQTELSIILVRELIEIIEEDTKTLIFNKF